MPAENPGYTPEDDSKVAEGNTARPSTGGSLNRRQFVVGAAATAAAIGLHSRGASAHESGQTEQEQNIVLGQETETVSAAEAQAAQEAWERLQNRLEHIAVDVYRVNSAFNQNNPEAQGEGYHVTAPEQALHLYQNGDHYQLSYEYAAQPTDPMALHIEAFAIYPSQDSFAQGQAVVIRSGSESVDLRDDPDLEAVIDGRTFFVVQALMTEGHENWISVATSDPQSIEVKAPPQVGLVGEELNEVEDVTQQTATEANPALAKDQYAREQVEAMQNLGNARPDLQPVEPAVKPEPATRPVNPNIGPIGPEPSRGLQPETSAPIVNPNIGPLAPETSPVIQPEAATAINPNIGPIGPEPSAATPPVAAAEAPSRTHNLINTAENVAPAVVAVAAAGHLAKRVGLRQRISNFFRPQKPQPPAQPSPEFGGTI